MKCALCDKTISEEYSPFCSKRCANIDLYKWLNEDYTIPPEESIFGE